MVDQGTGSTVSALADRGLVEVNWRGRNVCGQLKPHIRLTPVRRRLGRSWTGTKACKPPPRGTLKEWHLRALAKAYAVGDQGVEGRYGEYGGIGWPTWLRLRDYTCSSLIDEVATSWYGRPASGSGSVYRLRITLAGRELYERDWTRYRELYPDVEALPPAISSDAPESIR